MLQYYLESVNNRTNRSWLETPAGTANTCTLCDYIPDSSQSMSCIWDISYYFLGPSSSTPGDVPPACTSDLNSAHVSPLCHCTWQDVQVWARHASQVKGLSSVETQYTMSQPAVGQYFTISGFFLTYSPNAVKASLFLSRSFNKFRKSFQTRGSPHCSMTHFSGNSGDFSCWMTQLLSKAWPQQASRYTPAFVSKSHRHIPQFNWVSWSCCTGNNSWGGFLQHSST